MANPNQCLYTDPSVYVKTEYDQDSPNPQSSMTGHSGLGPMSSPPTSVHAGAAAVVAAAATSTAHPSHQQHPQHHHFHQQPQQQQPQQQQQLGLQGTSLWSKYPQLPNDLVRQLHSIYRDDFPLEVRHSLAGWLEANFFHPHHDLDLDQASVDSDHMVRLVGSMMQQLEARAAETPEPALRNKLERVAEHFRQKYNHNPIALYNLVRSCLYQEMNLLQRAEQMVSEGHSSAGTPTSSHATPTSSAVCTSESAYQIQQQLNELKKSTQDCSLEIEKIKHLQETHQLNFYRHHQISVQLEGGHFPEQSQEYTQWKEGCEKVAAELRQSFNALKVQTSSLINHHLDLIKQIREVHFKVVDQELNNWKREQQLAGNGAPFANNLDQIQKWCEDLAELIWLNRQQIHQVSAIREALNLPSDEMPMNILPELNEGLNVLLDNLVKSSFVIEKQPPQVLKTNTRFSATVRLLVGTRLNIHMNPPIVTVSIISEAQANSLLRAGSAGVGGRKSKTDYSSGEILNNKQTMEFHQATGQLSVSFRNMSLKKIKRAEKKGTESVMDEKFALLFWSEFIIGNGEYPYQVCAPSLPVVVIVHGNQEPHAWATILWDNAFAEWNRQPFVVPDKVPWFRLADTLNMKFKASCGRGLNEDNLRFLACKAFRSHGYTHDFSTAPMSWSQFCKEPLPDRSFTFWDWFHAVMKLTKEDLRGLWIDGALMGFISRQEAEDYLHKSENGTFLIRFSDSELGGVTVAWITVNESTGHREVAMLQPFTRKDLMIRSLPDRISDCGQMIYLYPNIRKEVAFGKYYSTQHDVSQPRNPRNGYVPHHLINVIQGPSCTSLSTDRPANGPSAPIAVQPPSVSSSNSTPSPSSSSSSMMQQQQFQHTSPPSRVTSHPDSVHAHHHPHHMTNHHHPFYQHASQHLHHSHQYQLHQSNH